MKWNTEVVGRLWLLSQGANWAVWPQSEIHPGSRSSWAEVARPGGQQIGPIRTTQRGGDGDWHELHCAYWQGPPSGKKILGHRSWSWIRATYRAGRFLELTWLTGPLNCPNSAFQAKRSTREPEEISSACLLISGVFDGYCGWASSNEYSKENSKRCT